MVFLELPRYYLPMLGLLICRWLRLPRVDEVRRTAFLARAPLVSIVIAGRNEEEAIEGSIRSLLEQDYPNFEVIVIDDGSDDRMHEIASRYSRRGQIRLIKNASSRGRSGRPSATNMGVRLANGEFIVSLDADTSYDRTMLRHLIEPLADPRIGVVAGNVLPENTDKNLLTRLQTIEYAMGIDINKQWTAMLGTTVQASGAIGAFRRSAVLDVGCWEQELAEDSDISLRMIKAGWKIAFAPEAVARTDVPDTWGVLSRQRARWDRGGLRTLFKKHTRLLRPSAGGLVFSIELFSQMFFFLLVTLAYPIYIVWLLTKGLFLAFFVLGISAGIYSVLSILSIGAISVLSDRIPRPWALLGAALLLPAYKGCLRWVRLRAFLEEFLQIGTEDSYLPTTAWANTRVF
jgi:cellulose synthase/poly-beta-1,6-N-acetylglucosamine synthase-like glycosyltransferase